MRRYRLWILLAVAAVGFAVLSPPANSRPGTEHKPEQQGQGLVIELDNKFIEKYENQATITSEFKIADISAVHLPKNDGEIHVGGWAVAAGLAGVSEVMNAAHDGKKAMTAFRQAKDKQSKVTVTGAWRLWGEHGGTASQIQAIGSDPTFPLPGEFPSNPDHV